MLAPAAAAAIATVVTATVALAGTARTPRAVAAGTASASTRVAGATFRQPQRAVTGMVFDDANGNGRRDPSERGVAGVVVSDQDSVVVTGADGSYRLTSDFRTGVAFVSVPSGYRAGDRFWVAVGPTTTSADFALRRTPPRRRLTLLHASDTHIAPASLPRMARLRALIDSLRPDLVLITGDLVRDALRVGEGEARGYYELFEEHTAPLRAPLFTVPGNHEIFGIERDRSKVSAEHPLYGRTMYRHYRGPDYYSFNAGGLHFVALNTVDIDDTRYYGHVDSLQLAWLARDLAAVPPRTPVVTFNHIPFFSAAETINGLSEAPPAPSVIVVNGKGQFRHTVSNARDVIARIAPHPYPLALAGHTHTRESLRYAGVATRFDIAAAIVAPSGGPVLGFPSGVTLYSIASGTIGEGKFLPLGIDAPAPPR
ncbi:MAG TPA: metallophosphoesterase [Gemmatimonadaceae bacterium]|nr:metallophosphoesterase [Gemmatimonadaceae bacterium]